MNALNMKNILLSLMILIFAMNPIFASCGSCEIQDKTPISKKSSSSVTTIPAKKSSSFVTTIPKSGNIEGFVISSCGMCNFGYRKSKGCSLTIKIGDTVYPVEGTSIHNHGNPHSSEGFCSAIRVAHVSGKIEKNKFHSNSFTLIESPE